MSDPTKPGPDALTTLGTAAARNLATTTKSAPQMQGITPRWLLRMLPWVQTKGGVYRVNRRLSYAPVDGRVDFTNTGARVEVIPESLGQLPFLRGFGDAQALSALGGRFEQREYAPGEAIVEAGAAADQLVLIAHGRVRKLGEGKYGDEAVLGTLADGDHLTPRGLLEAGAPWSFTARAVTPCTALSLSRRALDEAVARSPALRAQLEAFEARARRPQDAHGQAAIALSAGHTGEPSLPGTFVDYERSPREYELSVAQTVLRLHTRVTDLFNEPMNQLEQQLRLTVEALRERQEHELINNREFGLLHNADLKQRIYTRGGAPTPDDLDELLSRRRKSQFFLAHPRAIAAFGRECNRRGLYPATVEVEGKPMTAWRGVPLLPCDKIPISRESTTSILVLRTGEEAQGVIGLHQTGIPDEYQPSLNVRFMGIDGRAISSYLVSAYYSAAVLVPDALGVLEGVELGR